MPVNPSADERALFLAQVADATPLRIAPRAELISANRGHPIKRVIDPTARPLFDPLPLADRLDISDNPTFARSGISAQTCRDLRRGRWVIQQEIDLHGQTREAAREALSQFLHLSLHQGYRCVRIITGRGLRSTGQVAILRTLTRNWLTQCPDVLAYCPALPADGGEGALVVLLRNTSKTQRSQDSQESA